MEIVKTFYSRHFSIKQLANGIYAAINNEEGWAICNAGIIDLGDRTLVYDTFSSPQAASDLRTAAETLTGRSANMVVNSHYHNDHIWGNQAFTNDVDIISTAKTRDLIITQGAEEVKDYSAIAPKRLSELQEEYSNSGDESLRRALKPLIYNYQAVVNALPILQVRLPNLTFSGDLVFNGLKRSARLIPFENGHCGSDTILYLPDDGIVFMEDIFFNDCHPYLADGDPEIILNIIEQVKSYKASIFVPGHGPLGTIKDLDKQVGYINRLKLLTQDAIHSGARLEQLEQITIPNEYQHFPYATFFTANLKFLYHYQLKKDLASAK